MGISPFFKAVVMFTLDIIRLIYTRGLKLKLLQLTCHSACKLLVFKLMDIREQSKEQEWVFFYVKYKLRDFLKLGVPAYFLVRNGK